MVFITDTLTEKVTETSVGIRNAYVDAAYAVKGVADAGSAVDDARRALSDAEKRVAQGTLAKEALDDYRIMVGAAIANLAQAELAAAAALAATAAGAAAAGTGFYVSGSAQHSETTSTSTTAEKTWRGSNLSAANMTVNADKASIIGSSITAGQLELNATDILIGAGRNEQSSSSTQKSKTGGFSASSNGAGSWNANVGTNKADSESNATQYVNSQINVGHLESSSDNLTVKGGVIAANTANISTSKLHIESLQDTHSSSNSSSGANIGIGGGASSTGVLQGGSAGFNASKGSGEGAQVNEQSAILIADGENSQITAKDTTLIGGMIANASREVDLESGELRLVDHGSLNFSTETLTVEDLRDYSKSDQQGFGVQLNNVVSFGGSGSDQSTKPTSTYDKAADNFDQGTTTLSLQNIGHKMEGETRATIGGGNVTVGGQNLDDHDDFAGLNRNINEAQVVILDQQTGALDVSVTVDNRMLSETGRAEIVQQQKSLGKNWQLVATGLEKDIQSISTDIVPNAIKNALKKADKFSLGLLPFDAADNGGLLSQLPVLAGSLDVAGGTRQVRVADDLHVLSNPELYVPADQLPGYDDLGPEGKAALEGLVVSRDFIVLDPDSSLYFNHTNGMMNTPAEAMVNGIEQTESSFLSQNYNPRHGFLSDLLEISTDKLGYGLTQGLGWMDTPLMTGAARQTGIFMRDVMAIQGSDGASFANHSQANILTLSGLDMLNEGDYSSFLDPQSRLSVFQFASYGSPVPNQTMYDALDRLHLTYAGSSANAGDFVAEGLGGNTGNWLLNSDGANFSNHTVTGASFLRKLPDAHLLLTGEKYPNSNNTNTLSHHSGYQCIVNCGTRATP